MIGYITLGTNNITKAAEFYDAIFEELGARKVHNYDRFVSWAVEGSDIFFAIMTPYNQEPASFGNGSMIAIKVLDESVAQGVHAKAMTLGAKNEGDPGIRQANYYCAYFRDLDGNKLNFYCVL